MSQYIYLIVFPVLIILSIIIVTLCYVTGPKKQKKKKEIYKYNVGKTQLTIYFEDKKEQPVSLFFIGNVKYIPGFDYGGGYTSITTSKKVADQWLDKNGSRNLYNIFGTMVPAHKIKEIKPETIDYYVDINNKPIDVLLESKDTKQPYR